MGNPNPIRILYNTKSDRQLICYVEIHNDGPPIISSIYGLKRERSIFDKVLYEVDSSGIP
jgi:hypothetical protein